MRVITVARKPLAGSVAQTCLKYGTGGLNIDGCRISTQDRLQAGGKLNPVSGDVREGKVLEFYQKDTPNLFQQHELGRWPANLTLQHQPECQEGSCAEGCPVRDLDNLGETTCGSNNVKNATVKGYSPTVYGAESRVPGKEEISYGDSGSVARYFKQVKG